MNFIKKYRTCSFFLIVSLFNLSTSVANATSIEDEANPSTASSKSIHSKKEVEAIKAFSHELAEFLLSEVKKKSYSVTGNGAEQKNTPRLPAPDPETYKNLESYAVERAQEVEDLFFKGRYDRSRARLPENIDKWRSQPDIGNPGADLANFPNSAFTLPQGRAYVEFQPLSYYGARGNQNAQYNTEYLLRYGATDNIELRLFGNGVTWQGGSTSTWGFSPLTFDTKIHLVEEHQEFYLPAVGLEVYLQTQLLGSSAFNSGTLPGFTFNMDQSLPWDIDFEYNLGANEVQETIGGNTWQFSFQWAFQRDLLNKDIAVFIHGFYNAMTLPRLPTTTTPYLSSVNPVQNAVGAGLIWTPNNRISFWGQASGGTTQYTQSIITSLGFAVAF